MITIKKLNEVYLHISSDVSIHQEIYEEFKYRPVNYKFDPRFKNRFWDGYVSLYNKNTCILGLGILPELETFLKKQNYEYKLEGDFSKNNFTEKEALEFIKTLNIPEKYQIRDYQLKYFMEGVKNKKIICLSSTSSGKSLILYLFFRYFNKRTVLIVPTIALVTQMYEDFKSYGFLGDVHLIMEGESRVTDKQLIISTYQSLINEKKSWFEDKEIILADEVHTFQSKSLKKLMEKTINSNIKIGMTGTLQDIKDQLSLMTIRSLFGPIHKYITTKELIDRGFSSPVDFKIIILNHKNSPYYENTYGVNYEDEISYLLNSDERNQFIKTLALSLKENTFIMFNNKDHGKVLYEKIKRESKVPVFYVDGDNDSKERKNIINEIEILKNSITLCSKVFNTGINIHNLHNLILVHPTKSRIKTLQSIGRGLRKSPDKKLLTVYDIADKISKKQSSTFLHMKEREKMYLDEKFNYQKISVNI